MFFISRKLSNVSILHDDADSLNKINGNNNVKSPEALSHYEASTRKLRHRLNNFIESISEGAIANILAHVCLLYVLHSRL